MAIPPRGRHRSEADGRRAGPSMRRLRDGHQRARRTEAKTRAIARPVPAMVFCAPIKSEASGRRRRAEAAVPLDELLVPATRVAHRRLGELAESIEMGGRPPLRSCKARSIESRARRSPTRQPSDRRRASAAGTEIGGQASQTRRVRATIRRRRSRERDRWPSKQIQGQYSMRPTWSSVSSTRKAARSWVPRARVSRVRSRVHTRRSLALSIWGILSAY